MIGILLTSSCTNKNFDDLIKEASVTCDTIAMSYNDDIVPILQQNCYRCHDVDHHLMQGTVQLDEYQFLAPKATEGNLLCRIKHLSGCQPMPRDGGKLSTCEISKVEAWVNQGKKNN